MYPLHGQTFLSVDARRQLETFLADEYYLLGLLQLHDVCKASLRGSNSHEQPRYVRPAASAHAQPGHVPAKAILKGSNLPVKPIPTFPNRTWWLPFERMGRVLP